MNKVVVMTDTSSTISQKIAKEYDIVVIPWHVVVDGKSYLDTEMDMSKLYDRLRDRENLPTTSGYSMEECSEYFRRFGGEGKDVLYISMTFAMSPMGYNAAMQAKKIAQEKSPQTVVEVIDSRTVGPAQLLLVIAAAKAARQGRSIKEVVELANRMIPRMNEFEVSETLFYLDKGGRIFKAKSWAEAQSHNSFRTVVEIDDFSEGAAKPLARAKTKMQVMEKAVEIAGERIKGSKLFAAIAHTNAPEQAEQLKEMLLSRFYCDELYICEASAVIAIHNGEGLIEFGFYSSE